MLEPPGVLVPGAGYLVEGESGGVPPSGFHTVLAGLPQLCVEVDFANEPTNPVRDWVDVTLDIRSINYTRGGRNNALQQTEAGSLAMVLDNRAGSYDPVNAGSVYYPNVKRMRCIRVRAAWNGIVYDRFSGLVSAWVPSWPNGGKDAICSVTAADMSRVLSLFDLGGYDFSPARTDLRVLDVCFQPHLPARVSAGQSSVIDSGTISVGTDALTHLQDVENTENGRLYADAGGTIVFQDRDYRLVHSAGAMGTIGDGPGEIPYTDSASLSSDDSNVWNDIEVTPAGGTAEIATDTQSQDDYFRRVYTRALLTASQAEALAAAQWLLRVYKDPQPTLPALTLKGVRRQAMWPVILGADNSQRFVFTRRAHYGTISTDGFVEQVSETITAGEAWDTVLQLSPADSGSFWVLGDPTYGLLGETTFLSY